jgi:Mycothiol maleylpyruvate isomerase N-terminal domain
MERLDAVEERFGRLAVGDQPDALTEPEGETGERWDAGQVWAHVAEFVPYWTRELDRVEASAGEEPVPFGRVKSDPDRIAAIERDRHRSPAVHMQRLRAAATDLKARLAGFDDRAWSARGLHQTLGVMDAGSIVERFVVAHLEEHAEQLESLRDWGA